FVRALIITERNVCLIHFDRSGVYVSPYVNIHKDPATFIRLVLGLSSLNEADLGLDVSVKWTVDPETGKKTRGTITTLDPNGKPITYNLAREAPFIRVEIRGRGTTCWHAIDPETGKSLLIKDAWRTSARKPETEYLEAARGINGIVQMISAQDNFAQTITYRPDGFSSPIFHNRIKLRVVLEHYGRTLWHFESRLQLIAALKDAISAHKELFKHEILHRDISLNNILLGNPGAVEGLRGILIDLDMAIWTYRSSNEMSPDKRTGALIYHSVAMLSGLCEAEKAPPAQDCFDDMEAFFYVLFHI
ncbi:hypothetical protein DFP72DRAFT_792537, partial [Ephemerocybe angulata]